MAMSKTYRWYVFGNVIPGDLSTPYEVKSWSRTKESAQAKVDKLDPQIECKAFKVCAANRQEAMKDAVEVFGVRVKGYISPEDKRVGRAIVKAAVMRAIFCPYTGAVLDMRRAVVVSTPDRLFVCAATHWDKVVKGLADAGKTITELAPNTTVYDGRELFK
jgi:hypothetical protein